MIVNVNEFNFFSEKLKIQIGTENKIQLFKRKIFKIKDQSKIICKYKLDRYMINLI